MFYISGFYKFKKIRSIKKAKKSLTGIFVKYNGSMAEKSWTQNIPLLNSLMLVSDLLLFIMPDISVDLIILKDNSFIFIFCLKTKWVWGFCATDSKILFLFRLLISSNIFLFGSFLKTLFFKLIFASFDLSLSIFFRILLIKLGTALIFLFFAISTAQFITA